MDRKEEILSQHKAQIAQMQGLRAEFVEGMSLHRNRTRLFLVSFLHSISDVNVTGEEAEIEKLSPQ